MDSKLERELIIRFVRTDKRNRCLDFISRNANRSHLLDEFRSPDIFDDRYITEIKGIERNAEQFPNLYKSMGMGGRVYVISANDEWDGLKFQMSYIVKECLAMCIDTIGYCWKTKTAFYEWYHSGASYFLKR